MRLFGLIGYPLGHSFSASYFNDKFEKEGLNDKYQNFPLESIEQFKDLAKSNPSLNGINVTIPYKEAVIPYLDALSQTARAVQAVNTICFCKKSGRLGLVGHNTDINGFEKSLKENLKGTPGKALVLGTGGSSKAVLYVLAEMGIAVTQVSRSPGENQITYKDLSRKLIGSHQLIVNTTPVGMHPDLENAPSIPYEGVGKQHLMFDLIYNPEKTKFLELGEARGARIVNGHDMLIYQAEAAWAIWNRDADQLMDL